MTAMTGEKSTPDHAIPRQIWRRKTPLKKLHTLVRREVVRQAKHGRAVRLEAADKALSKGLKSLEMDQENMQSLTGFKWITSISLNAK